MGDYGKCGWVETTQGNRQKMTGREAENSMVVELENLQSRYK